MLRILNSNKQILGYQSHEASGHTNKIKNTKPLVLSLANSPNTLLGFVSSRRMAIARGIVSVM